MTARCHTTLSSLLNMSNSLVVYVVVFFLFLGSYALNLTALFLPKWLIFVTPRPFYTETTYGLFRLCRSYSGDCRPFPIEDQDCTEEGFCELWKTASTGMILAAVIGGLALLGLLATMCSNRRKRANGWKLLSALFILHAVPQAAAMGVVAYLFNSSSSFYVGTRYDLSFIFATISWCLSVVIAGILVLAAVLGPPDYAYESL
ncbi:hypothetical protein K450DRAFT_228071 [Umbelopsis ramanniana AG]|uniref:Uncharacterized protein n=1 Tax=Umbelopsis ramanniana AG TaxID=1314678 RepID=A0AAD5EHA2_UMBRA|nr:uncharacterized protein K450DRAFT_228071 [Umbelopsis ramanniana AG]KAI8582250.1 hypothetical protein K450DRAFT_228071 [Umbelopsis ramanniana AG]